MCAHRNRAAARRGWTPTPAPPRCPPFPDLPLNDGTTIPQLGFGTWKVQPEDAVRVVGHALAAGYRHIDTAQMYGNERQVGEAVRRSGLDRAEVYLTSKLDNGAHRPDDARRAFDGTLDALGTDYVDLFLIHWPLPTLYDGDFVQTWNALIEFRPRGPRALGRRLELYRGAPRAPR